MCQGALFELLGYGANTETGEEILKGTLMPPPDTEPATLIIPKEIAHIWERMGAGEINITVSAEVFQHYWRQVKDRPELFVSGVHFGHYKAAGHSDFLSEVHALKLSLITKTGSAPKRWGRGLSVMLEKIAGLALAKKLLAILLREVDFNCHNRLIFGSRMMERDRECGIIPGKIYSEKGKTAEDAILQ